MAAKFFTGLPLDAPDPECVKGHGETALAALALEPSIAKPRPSVDHSKPVSVPVTLGPRPGRPDKACEEDPARRPGRVLVREA